MIATIERHLSLYFKQKASIFFSLLGALIAFFLYIIFLQKNLVLSWEKSFTDPKPYLDFWIMGGVLAVTAITTSWAALSRIVSDKEQSVWDDLLLTDVSPLSLTIGYFLSGTLISLIMQGLVFVIMFTYFSWQDHLEWQVNFLPELAFIALLASLQASLFATIILQFVHSSEVESRLSTIIGTASGFLVGVYMPIGVLPDFAQTLVKLTPATYIASLYRQVMMKELLVDLGMANADFKIFMGIGLKWDKLTTISQDYHIVFMTIIGMLFFLVFLIVIRREKA
ncbi:ABC transporter permease [Streptococcus uberis]|uniref:ABC transporter permease n=1 Tax=Streptococcus uberis TaxID=1349 RepID=UPI0021F10D87|nr:ABC transporter permease [Streptococcus uberis]MCV6815786.1 ABC transporter permease [Streptococcus uberis]MCZ8475800.1 ABC transporter permease [Streptococcus uberis]MEE3699339.1 ABC transporter permease [Streptococcus uberis]